MKAIVMKDYGGPEVLSYEDVDTPGIGPDDVLVKVGAVSVNRTLDIVVREGKYARKPKLPHILGVDPSGVIVAVGANVTDRKIGDRVFCSIFVPTDDPEAHLSIPGLGPVDFLGATIPGGYAEYVRTMARCTMPIPDNLSYHDATVIGRHLATATNQVDGVLKAKKGDWILVMGASGGLGSVCIQVAKWSGATVIAAAGSDERVAAAMSLGADYGINYRDQDLTAEVMRITEGHGVDGVCENVADPELFPKVQYAMAAGATMVTAGNSSGNIHVPIDIRHLYLKQLHIVGEPREAPGGLAQAFERAREGSVKTLIDKVFPLREAVAAQQRVDERAGIGKVVIDPTME